MANTRFVDIKQFGVFERMKIKNLTGKYMKKIERDAPNLSLVLHCKKYDKEGGRAKYAFNAKLERPLVFTSNASDWDLATTLHKVMGKLETGIQKKFRTEGQKQGKIRAKQTKAKRR